MTNADFLRAVSAAPDDDLPRLVYADWLDEAGDDSGRARAELIRAQCELERDPRPARRKELNARVRRLLEAHAEAWLRPFRATKHYPAPRFRRGFPEAVRMSASNFLHAGDRLFRELPTLRAARFPDASNEVGGRGRLAASPHLARLAELDLHDMCNCGGCRIGDELRELFASPHAANLTALNVAGNRLGGADVGVLAASPHLDRLRSLDLAANLVGSSGARALAESPRLAGLRALNLRINNVGPEGGRRLARSPLAARLTHLDLSRNRLDDSVARAFAAADRPEPWRLLDLRENGIGPEVARQLRERFGWAVKV